MSPPIPPIPPRNSAHTPAFPFPVLTSCRDASDTEVSSICNALRAGEFFPLRESSGNRGELMILPKDIGPVGGESRVGARKYVFDILGAVREKGSLSRGYSYHVMNSVPKFARK